MLNQKKVEIFLAKFRKSPAKQFLEIAPIERDYKVSFIEGTYKNSTFHEALYDDKRTFALQTSSMLLTLGRVNAKASTKSIFRKSLAKHFLDFT